MLLFDEDFRFFPAEQQGLAQGRFTMQQLCSRATFFAPAVRWVTQPLGVASLLHAAIGSLRVKLR